MSSPEYTGLRRLFVFASGARPDILRSCPTEETAYTTLGGTVLTTAGLAAVSMTFALSIALRLPIWLCIPFGLVWGLAILNLDRWLITSTRRTESKIGQIFNALPRIALAVLLGFVISEPLVLAIFQPEITDEIEITRQEELRAERRRQDEGPDAARIAANKIEIDKLRAEELALTTAAATGSTSSSVQLEIDALRAEISTLQEEIRTADKTWLDAVADANEELAAGGVSGRGPGAGANYDLKLEKAASLEVVANELRDQNEATVAANQGRIAALQTDLDEDREAIATEEQARNQQTRERQAALSADIARLTGENTELQGGLDDAIADLEVETSDPGMIAQIEALETLGQRSPAIKIAHYLLAALFIFIDVLPVLGKLLQLLVKPRPYELTVEAVDRKAKMNAEIFAATAERERDDQLRKLTNESELRVRVEEENRRRFLEHAAEVQQRLGEARLRDWEAANGGVVTASAAVVAPPDERPSHVAERETDRTATATGERTPSAFVAPADEPAAENGRQGPSTPSLAGHSKGFHADAPTLFDDSFGFDRWYAVEGSSDQPGFGAQAAVVAEDDRLDQVVTEAKPENTLAEPKTTPKTGSSKANGSKTGSSKTDGSKANGSKTDGSKTDGSESERLEGRRGVVGGSLAGRLMVRDRRAYTPVIRSITVDPPVIIDGETVTVSWKTKHAEAVEVPGVGRFGPVGQATVTMNGIDRVEVIAIGPGGTISRTSEPVEVLEAVSVERLDVDQPMIAVDVPVDYPQVELGGPFDALSLFPSLLADDSGSGLVDLPALPELPMLPVDDLGTPEMAIYDDRSISDDA